MAEAIDKIRKAKIFYDMLYKGTLVLKNYRITIAEISEGAAHLIDSSTPYTKSLQVARSLLAGSTLLTIIATPYSQLFYVSSNYPNGVVCNNFGGQIGLYCTLQNFHSIYPYFISVVSLTLVLSGYFPQLSAPLHWWISWSFQANSPIPDGGDQLAAQLLIILLPVALFDLRKNAWTKDTNWQNRAYLSKGLVWGAIVCIWLQVSIVYFHAAFGKLGVPEWSNGTAMWYWIQDPTFAPPAWESWVMSQIFTTAAGSVILTLLPIFIEICLAIAIVSSGKFRRIIFPFGLTFHFFNGLVFGLWSFGLVMAGALTMYLHRPTGEKLKDISRPDQIDA